MGLDMYLERALKSERANKIKNTEEVVYWRKANQIREWFVNNTGYDTNADCEYHLLTKENLEDLVKDCKAVLADHSKASKLLPTSNGFFFGNEEYDEWYFDDLEYTIENITRLFETIDFDNEDIYYYEWW